MSLLEVSIIGLAISTFGFWGQVKFILQTPLKLIIVSKRITYEVAQVVLSHLVLTHKNRIIVNKAFYGSSVLFVKPLNHNYRVFYECLVHNNHVFFNGWRPIWYSTNNNQSGDLIYTISYLRGALDWDKLLSEIAQAENDVKNLLGNKRFKITHYGGDKYYNNKMPVTASLQKMNVHAQPEPSNSGLVIESFGAYDGFRLLHWLPEQIGRKDPITIDNMSLRNELKEVITEIKFFIESREWYESRGIPWRRGWLLHGVPGTGKTSFVRGVSVEFDLPVHVFDLSSMNNFSLRNSWNEVIRQTPCVVLIEDIDTVFDGRENVTEGELTFDCLLNCIGGISEADGILLFITSNKPDKIDPALTRGGRLDRSIEVLGLDHDGCIKLAYRILGDYKEAVKIADNPYYRNMTPADLQEELSKIAITLRFG